MGVGAERGERREWQSRDASAIEAKKNLEMDGRLYPRTYCVQQYNKDLSNAHPLLPRGKGYPAWSSIQPNSQVSVPKCRMLGLDTGLYGSPPPLVLQQPNL